MSNDLNSNATTPRPKPFLRPRPDGATDPAGEAGWYLERERVCRGLSLQAASQATGVHEHHLRAIEMGVLENLPEREEALRMIGAYARFLGFEPEPLVRHFARLVPMPQREREENDATDPAPAAFSSARIVNFPLVQRLRAMSRTPGGLSASVLAGMLLFGGLVWGLWPAKSPSPNTSAPHVARKDGGQQAAAPARAARADARRAVAARVETKEEALPDVAPQEALAQDDPIGALIARTLGDAEKGKPTARVRTRNASSIADARPPISVPAGGTVAPASVRRSSATTTQPPATPTARTPRPQAADMARARPMDNGPALHENALTPIDEVPAKGLALRATNMIWVRLEDDGGTSWYSGFLRPGQVLKMPEDRMLRLTAGDVHRLEWFVNGRRMGRLGQRGADFISEPLGRFYKQGGLKTPGTKRAG